MTRTALVPFVTAAATKAASGSTSGPSPAFTPKVGDMILVSMMFASGASNTNPSITDSVGLAWQTVALAGGSNTGRFRVWMAIATAETSMTVTANFTAAITSCVVTVTTVRGGQLLAASVVQALVAGAGQPVPLAYPASVLDASGNVPARCLSLSVFGAYSSSGLVAPPSDPAGYTQLANDGQVNAALNRAVVQTDYASLSPPASMTWTTSSGTALQTAAVAMLFVPNAGPDPRVLSRAVPVSTW